MDTGPLVAWFCPKDKHHAWARATFDELPPSGVVCEAVLAEACHLAAKDGVAPSLVLQFVERGGLRLVSLAGELTSVRDLLDRYANVKMDFADACVVRLAQLYSEASVCTVDGDFLVYRRSGRTAIGLIAPFSG